MQTSNTALFFLEDDCIRAFVRKQAVPYSNRRRNFTKICASTGMTGAIM